MALSVSPQEIVESGEYPLLVKHEAWERVPLELVATVQNGFPFESKYFERERGVPLIRIRDVTSTDTEHRYTGAYHEEFLVSAGDILIGMDGDFTAARWNGPAGLLNQRVCRIVPRSAHFDPDFLLLCLQPYLNAINAETSSVTVKHLSSRSVQQIPLPLPPLPEQRRIVAKIEELFSELDKGVDALTTARQQLAAYRHAILKHAFEGRLTEDWRLSNLTRLRNANEIEAFLKDARRAALEMNGRGKNKSPAPFDNADLPECPAEWALVSMDSLCHHITSGSRDWSQFYGRGTSTFIMAQNIRPGRYDGSVIQYVDPPMENAETERTRVQTDDILVTIVGANTGDLCRFPLKSITHYVCQSVALMRLSCPEYARFVELYFQSRSGGQRQYTRYIYGAGRPHLSFEQLKQTVVPIPDPREAAQIVGAVDAIFLELEAAESMIDAELARTTSLRHSVLKAAFSGQLVAQDPADEPASVLLERLRAEREDEAPRKRRNSKNGKKEAA